MQTDDINYSLLHYPVYTTHWKTNAKKEVRYREKNIQWVDRKKKGNGSYYYVLQNEEARLLIS